MATGPKQRSSKAGSAGQRKAKRTPSRRSARRRTRIALLTGGGDCPGLNAVIRGVVKSAATELDAEVLGVSDGFAGLLDGRIRPLTFLDASGILALGGTILGTSNRANPFRHPVTRGGKTVYVDASDRVLSRLDRHHVDALVCVGGDGTMHITEGLRKKGVPVIGVPKTIDNDLAATDLTFGFDSAVSVATEAIDRLHTTAQSHHRVMIVEVMGRYAGWIALVSGLAGGGDIVVIPEIPFDPDAITRRCLERGRKGKRFTIIVVAEGARPKGGEMIVHRVIADSPDPLRLGGVGNLIARQIEERSPDLEARVTVLGHLVRGGSPTAFDRVLASRFAWAAVLLVGKRRFGRMVALQGRDIVDVPIRDTIAKLKTVPPDDPLIRMARAVGTHMGA